MSEKLRIVFMGTPDFAAGILKDMVQAGKNIVGVITAPDRPAGRGRKLTSSAVKEYAVSQNLKVLQPTNLKDEVFLSELRNLDANLQVVVAFRMLPKIVWKMPKYGTFNLHASLLPQYRGAAPINWAIINQEKTTGVTTFFIDEKIDTGHIISNKEVSIEKNETAGSLHDKLMVVGSQLVLETLNLIEDGNANPMPQPNPSILLEAPKLTPENTRIDWKKTGVEINAFIRGLSPYPVAWSILINNEDELKVKIYDALFENVNHGLNPGEIETTKNKLKVACSDGYVHLLEMQMPGKRRMEVSSLLNGYAFDVNAKLL
ncbi:MAG: methionyl-tRNA formyltransferase [Aequorivita sp.]